MNFFLLTFWGVIAINMGLFKVKVQIWKTFFVVAQFQIFLGMSDILYVFGDKE